MEIAIYPLSPTPGIPNSRLPLIAMAGAIPAVESGADAIIARFRRNGWRGTWVYTVFDYWHYHDTGHEVLGCSAGTARIGFGGEGGVALDMKPGDVVLIPAGVGHRRLSASADFVVVGAYPPNQDGTVIRAGAVVPQMSAARIEALALPETDPVSGERPGAFEVWSR